MPKKKEAEPTDYHVREAYIEENRHRDTSPAPMPLSPTSIPMQTIAPIPVATPPRIEPSASTEKELKAIKGINEKTELQLKKMGINNIDDLAEASAENIAKELNIDLSIAQGWITRAKELH